LRHPLLRDIFWAGIDFGIGLAVVFGAVIYLQAENYLVVFAAAGLGALPDLFTLLQTLFPRQSALKKFRRFHFWIHARKNLDDRHFWGPIAQILLVFVFLLAAAWFKK